MKKLSLQRCLVAGVLVVLITSICWMSIQVYAQEKWGECRWVGVERAGINSHQPERAWCPDGFFLVAFDLDGDKRYSAHDTPIVGQALCCNRAGTSSSSRACSWNGVERAGINSHQPGPAWGREGTFLVAIDLDGDRNLEAYDAPVIGQAMSCSLADNPAEKWGACAWVGVEKIGINSHQPGRAWCPEGFFLTSFDLDGNRNLDPHDAPVIGQAQCCSAGSSPGKDLLPVNSVNIEDNRLVVSVKNQGDTDIDRSTITAVDFGKYGEIKVNTPPVKAGQKTKLYIEFPHGCFNPDCVFTIKVDFFNDVPESNEQNNSVNSHCIG